MFRYITKGLYGPAIDNAEYVATIDELLELCKSGDVARVIIPMTGYYYGAGIMDESNRRSIQRDYAANRFKDFQGDLTVSAYQFVKHEWIRELIENLQENYPVYDDSDYSELEQEKITEFVVDELYYANIHDDNFPDLDREEIERVLFSGSWQVGDLEPIEFWNYAQMEDWGRSVYMEEKNFEILKAEFIERWAILPMGDSSE